LRTILRPKSSPSFSPATTAPAQLYETRIKKLADDYHDKGVALVAIEPNDATAIRLDELGFTDVSDSLDEMLRAEYRHFNFPYLYDGETQSVSNAYGPVATPHIFIFDSDRILRYQGRIDNSQRESLVKTQDARNALDALLTGKPVAVDHTGVFGCSTKWKSKQSDRLRELQKIEARRRGGVEAPALESYRQSGRGEFLGDLVRAVRRRNAGSRDYLPHVSPSRFRFRHRRHQSAG
jgi:hypothetical protein